MQNVVYFIDVFFTHSKGLTTITTVTPDSFTFTDGLQTMSSALGSSATVGVIADATGTITQWNITATNYGPQFTVANILSEDYDVLTGWFPGFKVADQAFAFNNNGSGSNSNQPGTWVMSTTGASPVPEPTSLALSAVGLSLLAGLRLRRSVRPTTATGYQNPSAA